MIFNFQLYLSFGKSNGRDLTLTRLNDLFDWSIVNYSHVW